LRVKEFVLIIMLLITAINVFARGTQDEDEIKTQNDEWILCITEFDNSALPAEKRNVSDAVSRELVARINTINYRTRISPEYAYYEGYAHANERTAAAKTIAAKLDERSRIIYRGEADWRYKQHIKKIDKEIEALRLNYEEVEKNIPLINREPEFKLHERNLEHIFPAYPDEGNEVKFLKDNKADAFLKCSVSDFHGRFFLSLKLYALYTRSIIWEDSIMFSHNDFNSAVEEITRRLLVMLSGNRPAIVSVKTEPQDTLVLINRSFVGRGEIANLEYPPGKIIVTASAPEHDSITFETEIAQGEQINLNIRLNPLSYGDTEIFGKRDGHVYHGALYAGESPMTLRLPSNKMEYIEIISEGIKPDGQLPDKINKKDNSHLLQSGSIVFQTPNIPEYYQVIPFRTTIPLGKERINKDRDIYYWTWGGMWITGITAWIIYYTYGQYNNVAGAYGGSIDGRFQKNYVNMYYASGATLAVFGAVSAYSVYRMIRYIINSGKGTPSIMKPARRK